MANMHFTRIGVVALLGWIFFKHLFVSWIEPGLADQHYPATARTASASSCSTSACTPTG
jgi:hypothetical protein